MRNGHWAYTVRGFASNKHQEYPAVKYGDLLLETVHADKISKDMEVEAWRARLARSDGVAYIEVISHVEPFGTEKIYK